MFIQWNENITSAINRITVESDVINGLDQSSASIGYRHVLNYFKLCCCFFNEWQALQGKIILLSLLDDKTVLQDIDCKNKYTVCMKDGGYFVSPEVQFNSFISTTWITSF